jgi:hypothetical protein
MISLSNDLLSQFYFDSVCSYKKSNLYFLSSFTRQDKQLLRDVFLSTLKNKYYINPQRNLSLCNQTSRVHYYNKIQIKL